MPKKDDKTFEQLVANVVVAAPLSAAYEKKIINLIQKELNVREVSLNVKINPHLLGGFQLQIGSTLIDLSVSKKLHSLQQILEKKQFKQMTPEKFEDLLSDLEKEDVLQSKIVNVGHISSVKDGIVRVTGMRHVRAGELIEFANNIQGIVFNLNKDFADVVLLSASGHLDEGDLAIQTGSVVKVPVGPGLIGRVVNGLGEPIDGNGPIRSEKSMPLEAAVPGIIDRQPVSKPFQTGLKVVDALVPIGLGQRELIVGDRQTGKTSIIIDSILNQKQINDNAQSEKDKIYCVYVCIGQKQSTVAEVVRVLDNMGAMDYTCVVCANASDTASQQYLAPFTGTTIAEYFRDNGMNAVVFYDDLSKHANAYRQISLLLRRPPGREAYPGDIFYLHSRLLERSAMMSDEKGGGSLTAIPVVETQEGDLSAYIPTNVISITDGQIFLENALFHQGVRPAVNVGLSVSRVGSKAQKPLLAQIAGSMKLELAQYREMLSFAQIASDLDSTTQELLQKGIRLTEVLKQTVYKPLSFVDEFISIYAVVKGFYVEMKPADILDFEQKMLKSIHLNCPDLIDDIEKAGKTLSSATTKQLDDIIREAISEYMGNNQQVELND
ncbi:MAG: F0F1 ATP synthase subunit alpha [Alphaproteobacteria bacterium]|nr:F0F1 ATP synthase subunit alpha [Alphaproteobacteria bacterium]